MKGLIMKTMNEFVTENRIRISSEWTDSNPNMIDSRNMNHYKVTLRRGRKQMSLYFSMGYGLRGEPDAASVIDCLVSDSYAADVDFEDWCSEFGYDVDSRKAEYTYKICVRQGIKLKRFLGSELYDEVMNEVERM
jgi:hypothetical protein